MKRTNVLCLLLAVAGLSFIPAQAEAHTLTPGKARLTAQRFLDGFQYGDWRVKSCYRISRHAFDCVGKATTSCLDVRVRFASKRSRRTYGRFTSDTYRCP